jgi:shikimate kinase
VVAAAASAVDDDASLAALREPFVVWLRAPAAVLAQRIADGTRGDDHRRQLGDATAVAELEAHRAGRFDAVADLTIDTVADGTTTSPDAIVATVLAALQPTAPGTP